jgi:peptidyl-prolyl cis-trans isomerase D
MSVLASIRNRSGLLVTIIAVALLIFILQSALESRTSFFSDSRTTVGSIDGTDISIQEFEARMDVAEQNEKSRTGQTSLNDNTREALRTQVWNQFLLDNLMKPRYSSLGIGVSSDELFDMVQGSDPHPSVKQSFTDPNTGIFNPQQVINFLKNMDNDETGATKNRWMQFEAAIKDERVASKYNTLIKKGLYITKTEARRDYEAKNTFFDLRLVFQRYSEIADSTITVSDEDLRKVYNENKNRYTQQFNSRGIEYVSFEINPSREDRVEAYESLVKLMDEFRTAEVDSDYVNRNADTRFVENYVGRLNIQPGLDTLFNAAVGTVVGPISDGKSFKLAKLTASRMAPDSVKARHILFNNPENNIAKAKAEADSVVKLIKGGRKFEELAKSLSKDPGSAEKGGDLGWFKEGMMVKPFNDACFFGKKGELQVVESQFGVHLIEVMDKGKETQRLLISYLDRMVNPSSKTFQAVYSQASEFAGKNTSKEAFDKAVTEKNLAKRSAPVIRETDRTINGIENSREAVRWAFQANKGDVSKFFELGNQYVVAILTSIKEKGILPLEEVKEQVEAEAKKEKKAKQMIEKINQQMQGVTSIDQLAGKLNSTVIEAPNTSFGGGFISNVGREPVVLGSMWAMKENTLSSPVKGDNGVLVTTVTAIRKPESMKDFESVIGALAPALTNRVDYSMFEAIKDKADIEDNRARFY